MLTERLKTEIGEMRVRVSAFGAQLAALDWKYLWRLSVYVPHEFAGLSAVIQGVKPAFVPETESSALADLIPPKMEQVVITNKGWFADLDLIRKVIRRYPKRFPDFDFNFFGEDNYVIAYLDERTLVMDEASREEIIKTGLLLGYPHDSVVYPKRCRRTFEAHGYMFLATAEDSRDFMAFLETCFQKSGLKRVKEETKRRIHEGFSKMLQVEEGGAAELSCDGRKFLEVVTIKKDEGGVIRQLALWQKSAVSEADRRALLNLFAERFGVISTMYSDVYVGADCLMLEAQISSIGDSELPYLILSEYVDRITIGAARISRYDLDDYARSNLK